MTQSASLNHFWLKNSFFDLTLFQLSAIFCLAFMVPWYIWGQEATIPVYNFYLVFFGIPHNFLTWASFVGKHSDQDYHLKPVATAASVCAVICLIMYLNPATELESWILSVITYASLWHAYRQHHGICKVYDTVQSERLGDKSIFDDRKLLNLGFGLCIFSSLVWLCTHEEVKFLLSAEDQYKLIYPRLSFDFFIAWLSVSVVVFLSGFFSLWYKRRKKGLWMPWPQIVLMIMALATYSVPFVLLPLEALPIGVAIATMFHNIQYFGFVWIFEKTRGVIRSEEKKPLRLMERFAVDKKWHLFLGIAFAYSLLMVGLYGVSHSRLILVLIYFLAFAHYIIDGLIWRPKVNLKLSAVLKSLARYS